MHDYKLSTLVQRRLGCFVFWDAFSCYFVPARVVFPTIMDEKEESVRP